MWHVLDRWFISKRSCPWNGHSPFQREMERIQILRHTYMQALKSWWKKITSFIKLHKWLMSFYSVRQVYNPYCIYSITSVYTFVIVWSWLVRIELGFYSCVHLISFQKAALMILQFHLIQVNPKTPKMTQYS